MTYLPVTSRMTQEANFSDDQILRIQKCRTRNEYEKELKLFQSAYPKAADYLDGLTHEKTFLYSILAAGYTTHGHQTSNLVEITNNVIKEPRHRDPYFLLDFMVIWHGEKIDERQGRGRKLMKNKSLLTVYAARLLGKSEHIAAENPMEIRAQGVKNYLVSIDEQEEGETSPVAKRYVVNLVEKTCSCSFMATHRIPCAHVVAVLDHLNLRDTVEDRLTFMKEWIAPYFMTKNYVDAYEKEYVKTPVWDTSSELQLPTGVRIVTAPSMKKNHTKRNPVKRKTQGSGGRRTRGVWDARGFCKRKRRQGNRAGPANPFVRISNPDIFKKKPCGRKPLTYQQRREGSDLARQQLLEAIEERKQGSKRTGSKRTRSKRGRQLVEAIEESKQGSKRTGSKRGRSKRARSKTTRSKTTRAPPDTENPVVLSQPAVQSLAAVPEMSVRTQSDISSLVTLPVIPVMDPPDFSSLATLPALPLVNTPSFPITSFGDMNPYLFSPVTPFGFNPFYPLVIPTP